MVTELYPQATEQQNFPWPQYNIRHVGQKDTQVVRDYMVSVFETSFGVGDPPPPPGGGPLDVSISGPDWAPEHAWEACSWSAVTTGGSGTPSYQWKWNGQFVDPPTGPGPDWWGDTGTQGYKWIEVTVTDASGSAYDAMEVYVDAGTQWGNCL